MNDAAHSSILVVEDDPAVRNLVTTALDLPGYSVETATDGETAIMDAASRNPDLIMLDLGLPDIDGVEVINKIRSWSAVPNIVISARVEDSDKIGALDAGADDYLTKPFSVEEMLARVRANLRRSTMIDAESVEASTFDNGGLHIDYAAGYAELDGERLSLTPTEYKLLVLLAKNVDKVLTHTFITHEIWGTSWDSDIASLRVFMRTLRKKIEADPDLGDELGQRHREPTRVHANPAQEDRGRPIASHDDPDARRSGLPHAAHRAPLSLVAEGDAEAHRIPR